jgi:DNA-binding Lrp family transcriptional regulator
MDLTEFRRRLLDDYQRDFPLEPEPFARIAAELGVDEGAVLETFSTLRSHDLIDRLGAVVRANTVGASTLAAMTVPVDRLEEIAERISAQPEVNHCYEREHEINLWFVVTAVDRAAVAQVLDGLRHETGLPILDLPMIGDYHIDLGFPLR